MTRIHLDFEISPASLNQYICMTMTLSCAFFHCPCPINIRIIILFRYCFVDLQNSEPILFFFNTCKL